MKKLTMLVGTLLLVASAHGADNATLNNWEPLAGTWEATVNGQTVRTVITYAAHGAVAVEKMAPETQNALKPIIGHGGRLTLTQSWGGSRRFNATRFDGKTEDFKLFRGATVTVEDTDHFTEVWRSTKDGKESVDVTLHYTRVN